MDQTEKLPILVFDSSSKNKILKALGISKNERNELIDCEGKIMTSQDFESISYGEFGGILDGSKIPIKNEESELVKYFTSKNR